MRGPLKVAVFKHHYCQEEFIHSIMLLSANSQCSLWAYHPTIPQEGCEKIRHPQEMLSDDLKRRVTNE